MRDINNEIEKKFDIISNWINSEKSKCNSIPYCSIDIRESSFKVAGIDTNLFPAGFNNLNQKNGTMIESLIKNFIKSSFPRTKNILLFCEDHTRNLYYLENIFNLSKRIKNAGFNVIIGSFFHDHPQICQSTGFLKLKTAENNEVKIFCLNFILRNYSTFNIELCLLNNDLSDGNYELLTKLNIPILPDPKMGWHHRKKSTHIYELNQITKAMINACNLNIDPWQLSTLFKPIHQFNINNEENRKNAADLASDLLKEITQKYKEHNIKSTPYYVLKSDNGTYGMGVVSLSNPNELINLNRKNRNKLLKGKSSLPIENLIIQEGIPSAKTINNFSSEEVIYLINGSVIGGFYRIHEGKSEKDILNSKGMQFKAFDTSIENFLSETNKDFNNYGISKTSYVIAQLANLSAQKEVSIL
tara:strand:+ start:1286 stop:2530 length:1245 start_codon:yes stop_codon:yes gene_type:complete